MAASYLLHLNDLILKKDNELFIYFIALRGDVVNVSSNENGHCIFAW